MKPIFKTLKFIVTHPLARRNKYKALKRFFYYQFSKLINPYPIVYPFTNRTKLIIESGMTGATGNIYCGLHDFEEMSFLLHFLRPEDLFVDIGANIGSYTVLASGHVGAKTISIEPIPNTFNKLENNIAINFIQDNVHAYNLGISSKSGILKFTHELDTINHVVTDDENSAVVETQVETLDELLVNQTSTLIKIDVEGYEMEVLKGASRLLSNPMLQAIIIEINGSGKKYGYSDEEVHNTLVANGFKPYKYDPYKREIIELPSYGATNTIYLKQPEFVLSRLREAIPIQISGISY